MSYVKQRLLKTIVVFGITDLVLWTIGMTSDSILFYTSGAVAGYWIGYDDFWKRRE